MVPIGELVERRAIGTVVYDAHGETRVRAVKANGDKRVFRVLLRNGSFVEATGDHLVYAVPERRTVGSWLRVDQLRPGMRLHLYPHRGPPTTWSALAAAAERQAEAGGATTTLVRTEPATGRRPRPPSPVGCRRMGSSASTRPGPTPRSPSSSRP